MFVSSSRRMKEPLMKTYWTALQLEHQSALVQVSEILYSAL